MQMSDHIALWLQDELLGLDHEDYGLVYILSGNLASIPQDFGRALATRCGRNL